jgi:hypothetical protein
MNSTGLNSNGLAQSSFVGGLPKLSAKPHGRRPMGQGSIGSPSAIKPQSPFGDVFGTLNKLSSHLDSSYAEHNKPLPVEGKGLTAYRAEDNHYKLASLMLKVCEGTAIKAYGTTKSASWNPYDLISDKTYERYGHSLTSMLSAANSVPKVFLGKDFFPDDDKLKHQLTMNNLVNKGEATIFDQHRWEPEKENQSFPSRLARAANAAPPVALWRALWGGVLNHPDLGIDRRTADSASEYLGYAGNPTGAVKGLWGALSSVPKLLSSVPSAIRAAPASIAALPSMASSALSAPISSAISTAKSLFPFIKNYGKHLGATTSMKFTDVDRNRFKDMYTGETRRGYE